MGMAGAIPASISYAEMTAMADGVLELKGRARRLFFTAIEEVDSAVLADVGESMRKSKKAPAEKGG